MRRGALLLLLAVAFSAGFYKAARRPPPPAFAVAHPPGANAEPARIRSDFASSRLHVQTHAASLIELKDGRIRAFWFSGSREGARDVEIHSAVFDPARGLWGAEQEVADRGRTERALQRYVAKLGNPVPGRAADGSLWLYYVTVSLGGWAGSSITAMRSTDEGQTWDAPRRLVTSPFLNISTLVRNGLVPYADGTLAFPVYHEFISKFGELLRLGAQGAVLDKQRLAPGGAGTLQPVLLVQNADDALALMRHAGPPPHRAVTVATHDAGRHWSAPRISSLRNPDSAISAVVLADGRLLAVLNDLEQGRDALSLMISADGGASWKTVYQLEDDRGLPKTEAAWLSRMQDRLLASDARVATLPAEQRAAYLASVRQAACTPGGCRTEYSYPFLLQAKNGDFHVLYTWNRTFIKHVTFTPAWLKQQLEYAP
ncbi:MAG TPA: sialidase family protein [Gallionellaceae bacterium]|nr:sialidase family protein [Gallionellaceae bacterium]